MHRAETPLGMLQRNRNGGGGFLTSPPHRPRITRTPFSAPTRSNITGTPPRREQPTEPPKKSERICNARSR